MTHDEVDKHQHIRMTIGKHKRGQREPYRPTKSFATVGGKKLRDPPFGAPAGKACRLTICLAWGITPRLWPLMSPGTTRLLQVNV